MRVVLLLALCTVAFAAGSAEERIAGGSVATMKKYPFMALLFYYNTRTLSYIPQCGGVIITNRSVLTSASCLRLPGVNLRWRFRVGSIHARRGGVMHDANLVIEHHDYSSQRDADIAILRTGTPIYLYEDVQPASLGAYFVREDEPVWAAGWGSTRFSSGLSEELRHVQILTVNQTLCRERLSQRIDVTENHFCSGWLSDEPLPEDQLRGQCDLDFGGPIVHYEVVVGIHIRSYGCGDTFFPSVNTRVANYLPFIRTYA